ncbi:heavy-metal-associated domain-containing protein [Streptomyces sp. NPDC014894]|uniref:heavy-metal-associated domain-containing protein n=1 Tax=unclassified Streptomyces TaxID=2593676 RepID=UPI0036F67845
MASPETSRGDSAPSGSGEAPQEPGVTATYLVEGMVCAHCAATVTKAITTLDGVRGVEVDVQSERVSVSSDRALDDAELARTLDDIGYEMVGRA